MRFGPCMDTPLSLLQVTKVELEEDPAEVDNPYHPLNQYPYRTMYGNQERLKK